MADFFESKRNNANRGRPTLNQINRMTEAEYSALMKKHPVKRRYTNRHREVYQEASIDEDVLRIY